MASISVVISAFNEEEKIRDCLESVKWADEIVLVNSSSTDNTVTIVKEYTKKIYTRSNNPMLNVNKNFGFAKTVGDWILSLDADERVTPELRKEIESKIKKHTSGVVGFWIPRKNIIFGKWIQSQMWWPDYQLRLFKKGKGKFPQKHIHEKLIVDGESEELREPLLHENYATIAQFLYKMDKIYTENETENILKSNKRFHWVDGIRMPANDFIKTFFAQKGYRDGLHGLVLSILQAMYMEVVFAKVWEKQGFKPVDDPAFFKKVVGEMEKVAKDIRYWILTKSIEEGKSIIAALYLRIQRKLI